MKKGITPIVATIIMLLITIALAGAAWAFMQGYFTQITSKNAQISDSFCMGNRYAMLTLVNIGSDTLNLGSCSGATNLVTGQSKTCGDITITRSDGGSLNGNLSASSIAPKASVVLNDTCAPGAASVTCSYRVTTAGSAIGPNVATVSCAGG